MVKSWFQWRPKYSGWLTLWIDQTSSVLPHRDQTWVDEMVIVQKSLDSGRLAVDLTLAHRDQNSEIYVLWVLVPLSDPESFILIP